MKDYDFYTFVSENKMKVLRWGRTISIQRKTGQIHVLSRQMNEAMRKEKDDCPFLLGLFALGIHQIFPLNAGDPLTYQDAFYQFIRA